MKKRISRRDFLKLSALGLGSLGSLLLFPGSSNAQNSYPTLPLDFEPRRRAGHISSVADGQKFYSHASMDLDNILVDRPGHTEGNRLLIVYSRGDHDAQNAEGLARFMESHFGFRTTIKEMSEYKPRIDEYINDGIVYLGEDYNVPPTQGFLEDIVNTTKPVLWTNYHGWLLPEDFQSDRGIDIQPLHNPEFSIADFLGPRRLSFTDTVQIDGDDVLYELVRPRDGERVPGAVKAGNLCYLGYSPTFNPKNEDFLPFMAALQSTFGAGRPAKVPEALTYEQRLEQARKDPLNGGIIVPLYVSDSSNGRIGYDSDKIHENLIRIKESGADYVSLIYMFYQQRNDSSEVFADPVRTPTLESIRNFIQDAHDVGLRVQLKANLNVVPENRKTGEWSGTIYPKDPVSWWESYTKIIDQLATVAREEEVEALGLGLELTRMEGITNSWYPEYNSDTWNADQWRMLIKRVKESGYTGLVGYQANFDVFELVPWANELDHYGIAAYFPLAEKTGQPVSILRKGWEEPTRRMKAWAQANPDVPFEIFEIGYASQPNASVYPYQWSPYLDAKLDLEEQRRCFEALRDAVRDVPEIRGVYYFASLPNEPDPLDSRYIIFGIPPQQQMEEVFDLR